MKRYAGILVVALVGLAVPRAYGQSIAEFTMHGSTNITIGDIANGMATAIENNASKFNLVTASFKGSGTLAPGAIYSATAIERDGQFTFSIDLVKDDTTGRYVLQMSVLEDGTQVASGSTVYTAGLQCFGSPVIGVSAQ